MDTVMVYMTAGDRTEAERIGRALVETRLAACVNILPGAKSVYEWQGELHKDQELVLLIKTRSDRLAALEVRLLELHPYELPELVVVPLVGGLAPYLSWIETQLDKNK